jgi:hypothetical protein
MTQSSVHPHRPQPEHTGQSSVAQSGNMRTTLGGGAPANSSSAFRKNSSSQFANRSSNDAYVSEPELIDFVQRLALRQSSVEAARQQGVTPKAVEKQRNGESGISFKSIVNWCQRNPRVRADVIRFLGASGPETNPDFAQAMNLLLVSAMRDMHENGFGVDVLPDCAGGEETAGDLFGGAL